MALVAVDIDVEPVHVVRRRSRRSRRSRRRSRRSRRSRRRSRSRRRRRGRPRRVKLGRPMDLNKHRPERGCKKQSTKKYASRPGPPYPANLCRDQHRMGNDGRMYASTRAKKQGRAYYKWTKV